MVKIRNGRRAKTRDEIEKEAKSKKRQLEQPL